MFLLNRTVMQWLALLPHSQKVLGSILGQHISVPSWRDTVSQAWGSGPQETSWGLGFCIRGLVARKGDSGPSSSGPTTCSRGHRNPVECGSDGSQRQSPRRSRVSEIGFWEMEYYLCGGGGI